MPMHVICPDDDDPNLTEHEYVEQLQTTIKLAYELAAANNEQASSTQKQNYDLKMNKAKIQVGDLVFINRPSNTVGLSPKLLPSWKGPFIVCLIMGVDAMIRSVGGKGKAKWVHLNDCKLFKGDGVTDQPVLLPSEEVGKDLEVQAQAGAADDAVVSNEIEPKEEAPTHRYFF